MSSIELPSEIFYHNLKTSYNKLGHHKEECKLLYILGDPDSEIISICENLVQYLKTNYEVKNEEHLNDQHCNLLSLWIYEQLFEHFEHNPRSVIVPYANFKFVLSNVFTGINQVHADNCLHQVNAFISLNNWKKSKDLYDYCVDYDEVIKIAGSSYEKCKIYEEYFKQKSQLYEQFDILYIREYKNKNEDFYKKCKYYDPKKAINILKCEEKFLAQEKTEEFEHDNNLLVAREFSDINSNSAKTFGNLFLGVVASSMISGLLYKVNKILIKTYQL
ncbi:hypothetical protein PCYB_007090, partial [Plasmodium cynomolgi strain B]